MLHYTIIAKIDPVEQTLQAEATVTFPGDKLRFCLHKDLAIEKIEGPMSWNYSDAGIPFAPEARGIDLTMGDSSENAVHTVTFKYHGRLGITSAWEVNRISPNWTELGLYTPWYPLSAPMQNAVFSVELHLPPQYALLSTGQTVEKNGCWFVEQSVPALDCTLIIAPGFLVSQAAQNGAVVRASYTETSAEPAAAVFSRIGAKVLNWYNAKFGSTDVNPIDICIAPRLKGGGYARRGFIVFAADMSMDDEVVLFRYIGHEFAHLWWYRANTSTWEDWLNESLAEFSALLAVRNLLGQDTFARLLAVRREKAMNLPPVRGINREAEEAHSVLYYKGCVFLADLEAEIGEDQFAAFLQELVQRQAADTAEFLKILADFAGKEVMEEFSAKLGS